MTWLTEPLHFAFFTRALLAAVIVGVVGPVLGAYIVLRGLAFLGDALAHIILPGVVIAFLLGWPLMVGALAMGVLTALGIGALSRPDQLREDTVIGVIFAGAFALGVALLSVTEGYTLDLTHFLFGNLLGVATRDLWLMTGLGLVVLALIFLFYKELLVVAFDPVLAATLRLRPAAYNYLLLILMALTIVTALQVVGVALILAALVTPAAAASLLTHRLHHMMLVGAALGVSSGIVGLYASYYLNVASGPAVVLTATLLFVVVYFFAPRRGVVWRRWTAG